MTIFLLKLALKKALFSDIVALSIKNKMFDLKFFVNQVLSEEKRASN